MPHRLGKRDASLSIPFTAARARFQVPHQLYTSPRATAVVCRALHALLRVASAGSVLLLHDVMQTQINRKRNIYSTTCACVICLGSSGVDTDRWSSKSLHSIHTMRRTCHGRHCCVCMGAWVLHKHHSRIVAAPGMICVYLLARLERFPNVAL